MRIPGCQRQIVLPGHRGDPNVIVRNRPACVGKFGLQVTVLLTCALVWQKKNSDLEKLADRRHLRFPPLRAERPIVEFTESNPGQIDDRGCFQARRGAGIVPEVATTMLVSSSTLPAGFIDLLAAFLYNPIQLVGLFR